MQPMTVAAVLLIVALVVEVMLIRRRGRRSVPVPAEEPGAGYRWGAVLAGWMLILGAVGGFALFARASVKEGTPLPITILFIGLMGVGGVGLAQMRRYGVLALAAVGIISIYWTLAAPDPGAVAPGGLFAVIVGNWMYFRKRWGAMAW